MNLPKPPKDHYLIWTPSDCRRAVTKRPGDMESYKIITRETNQMLTVAAIKRHAVLFRVGRILT
jgi:hypothetical protein